MQSAYRSLPDVVKFEVAEFLGSPSFTMFIETAILHLQQQQINLTLPPIAEAARCQQFVAESIALRDKEYQLRELLQLGRDEYEKLYEDKHG